MASRSGAASFTGTVLMMLGVALLGFWGWFVFLRGAPLEEPANPGRTPNPSRAPWTFDPEPPPWDFLGDAPPERRRIRLAVVYGLPLCGLVLVLSGAFVLSGSARKGRGAP